MISKINKTLLILILALIASIFIVKTYNKEHVNIAKTKAKYTLTSQELIDDFLKDEKNANKKYVNKIIQVSGVISEIDNLSITIKGLNFESTILCNLSSNKNMDKLKQGQRIKIKGLCTGYLLDVVLVECILINK